MLTTTWKAAALLALAVVAGGAAGSALTSRSDACSASGTKSKAPGEGFVALLTDELALTPSQQDSVRAVLARHQPSMDALWEEIRPRVDSVRTIIRSEIAPHLTPDQKPRFAALTAQLDAERKEQREKNKRTAK
jgi:hypothetical protein